MADGIICSLQWFIRLILFIVVPNSLFVVCIFFNTSRYKKRKKPEHWGVLLQVNFYISYVQLVLGYIECANCGESCYFCTVFCLALCFAHWVGNLRWIWVEYHDMRYERRCGIVITAPWPGSILWLVTRQWQCQAALYLKVCSRVFKVYNHSWFTSRIKTDAFLICN